eukprot:523082-Amphidinium_carterae.2
MAAHAIKCLFLPAVQNDNELTAPPKLLHLTLCRTNMLDNPQPLGQRLEYAVHFGAAPSLQLPLRQEVGAIANKTFRPSAQKIPLHESTKPTLHLQCLGKQPLIRLFSVPRMVSYLIMSALAGSMQHDVAVAKQRAKATCAEPQSNLDDHSLSLYSLLHTLPEQDQLGSLQCLIVCFPNIFNMLTRLHWQIFYSMKVTRLMTLTHSHSTEKIVYSIVSSVTWP